MKKSISLILALVMVLGVFVSAPLTVVSYAGDVDLSDLYFELNDDGTGYLVSSDSEVYLEGELVIPDSYEGLPVVGVSDFSYEHITGLVIPDSVKFIDDGAFEGCSYLEKVDIGNGVEVIDEDAFLFCDSLVDVNFGNSLREIGVSAFGYCFDYDADISIVLPDSVRVLGDYCFDGALINNVVLNDGLEIIGDYCFSETYISTIAIPATVTQIGNGAFALCENLTDISVDSNSAYYCTDNGTLFTKDFSELVAYPYAKKDSEGNWIESYVIPDGVKKIDDYAFYGQYYLLNITIPDSVEEIGIAAFGETDYYYNYENWDENGALYLGDHLLSVDYGAEGLYTVKEGTKSIAGGAFMCRYNTEVYLPDSVKVIGDAAFMENSLSYIHLGDGVEKIAEDAFNYCSLLCAVEGTGSVEYIGKNAFTSCYSLECFEDADNLLKIDDGAFAYCELLDEFNFADGLEYIGSEAFYYSNIGSAILPESLVYMGEEAFSGSWDLVDVTIPGTLTEIPDGAFSDCALSSINIGEGVEVIGENAFSYNWQLREISLPDSVVEVKERAFNECESLVAIELGSGLKKIGAYAFAYAYNLTELVIPDNVEHIGQCAFLYANNLTSLKLGEGIKQIDFEAFSSCHKLPEVVIPAGIEELSYGAFLFCESLEEFQFSGPNDKYTVVDGVLFEDNGRVLLAYPSGKKDNLYIVPVGVKEIAKFAFCDAIHLSEIDVTTGVTLIDELAFYGNYLLNINLPTTLETIGGGAFYYSYNLTELTIPDSVTSIGEEAFSHSTNLIKVKLPQNLSEFPVRAFAGCDSLTTVRIPDGVEVIPEFTFAFCDSLTAIVIPESVKRIDSGAFYDWNEKPKNIKYVYYGGDVSNWDDVEIIEEGNEKIINASKILPIPDGHVFEWVVSQEATVYGPGLKVKQCLVCGDITESAVIPQKVPATPKITKVSRTSSGVKIEWNWIDGADEVYVYRKTKGGKWTKLTTLKPDMYGDMVCNFTDKSAKSGTTYYYTVKAKNEAGYSSYNKTGVAIKYVAAPKLTKIANESSGVRVYWSKVGGADGYYLYRRVAGTSKWTKVATVKKGSTTSYLDKKASAGKTYEYIIKAYDGSTVSASAAKVIKIKRLTVPKLSSAKSGKSGVTVKWGKVAGASGYIVYRKTGKGSWVQLKSLEGNTKVSYVDKSAKKGKTYTYTVRAYSGSYKSAYNTKGLTVKDKY